jgi:amino acid transporter
MGLEKALEFQDLVSFGIASIMGSGGFNIISDAVVASGPATPVAIGAVTALFQGASKVYEEAYKAFKTNTAESDVVFEQFGPAASSLSTLGILGFNIFSVSTILVIASKTMIPAASWLAQVGLALLILAMMSGFSLAGIDANKDIINIFTAAIAIMLTSATAVGLFKGVTDGHAFMYPPSLQKTPNFFEGLLLFFFILAGFDTVMKFVEESKNPDTDIPRSFYWSNLISSVLTAGIAYAYIQASFTKSPRIENPMGTIFASVFGKGAEYPAEILSVVLMIATAFICFLTTVRYFYGLASTKYIIDLDGYKSALKQLERVNSAKVPYIAVAATTIIAGLAVLLDNTMELVRLTDVSLMLIMSIVGAAVTSRLYKEGKPVLVEGATTTAFTALLMYSLCYRTSDALK